MGKLKIVFMMIGLGWLTPALLIGIGRWATPSPNAERSAFEETIFLPKKISVKGRSYFDLIILSENDIPYFHRDPDQKPIVKIEKQIPENSPLKLIYYKARRGNVILEITVPNFPELEILPFEKVMQEYASRRRLILIVAIIWGLVFNLLGFAMLKFFDIDTEALSEIEAEGEGDSVTSGSHI